LTGIIIWWNGSGNRVFSCYLPPPAPRPELSIARPSLLYNILIENVYPLQIFLRSINFITGKIPVKIFRNAVVKKLSNIVQTGELSEVAELRGDGASELIPVEVPVNGMVIESDTN